jgi:hypothetical protein
MASLTPQPPENDEMERDHRFWRGQNRSSLWGSAPIGTLVFGLELIKDGNWAYGGAFVVLSLVTLLFVDRQMRGDGTLRVAAEVPRRSRREPLLALAMLSVITWIAVGYDIYDRHAKVVSASPVSWDAFKFIDVIKQPYTNEAVHLDGKRFH